MKENGMNWRRVKGAVCHDIGMRSSCGGTNVRNALVPQASLMKGSERGKRERENDGRTLGTTGRSRCCFACLAGLLPCLSRGQDYKCAGHASDR